ncbi:hypothetical protein GGGNBK_09740 [Sporosarcina sp. ANT_H38]
MEIIYADSFNTRTIDVHSITSIKCRSCNAVLKLFEFNSESFGTAYFLLCDALFINLSMMRTPIALLILFLQNP